MERCGVTTTGAQDVATGLLSILNTYKTANPTLLKKVEPRHPGTFGELPCAYLILGREDINHDSGTRTRHMTPRVVYVSTFGEQDMNNLARVRDTLNDAFTAGLFAAGSFPIGATSLDETEEIIQNPKTGDSTTYPALVWEFGAIDLMEPRV